MSASTAVASAVAVGSGVAALGAALGVGAIARRPPTRTAARAASLASTGVPRRVARASRIAVVGATAALLTVVGGVILGLSAIATVPLVGAIDRRRRRTTRQRAIDAALPDAIELIVMCVHAGLTPTRAIEVVGAYVPPVLRSGLEAVVLQLHRGRRLGDALGELPRVLGPRARSLATAIAAADRDGLPLAPVLAGLAAEARAERRRQGEAAARRLPVRLSFPLVMCTLPSFVLLTIAPAVLGAFSTLRGSAP